MAEDFSLAWGCRTYIMGVINLTPDSFSGDGVFNKPSGAAELAERMAVDGADILDVGGESTKPGYQPVPLQEELSRVVPALRQIVRRVPLPVSVDTSKAEVARQALAEGASIINDVSGLRDSRMAPFVAQAGASLILVHNGTARAGEDAIAVACADLKRQIMEAQEAGVAPSKLLIDPGLGMGKGWGSNFEIIRRLGELRDLEKPLLVGPSRKGMIGRVLGQEPAQRLEGTLALVSMCVALGADVVRVHDVKAMANAARMMDAIVRQYP